MGKKVREYKSGDFIFAKVKGYPAWPARVQKPNGKKYFVYFYGTGETANLPPNMIFDYAENKDKFLNKSVKRKDFNDGVKQIEHDFANNVPLEQVVGALADAAPAPADDTMNDSANDTVDDSAIADTTADETMDETANSTAVNDGPVEDSDETGALVIDEGKQKGRKSTPKTTATPKTVKEAKTPRGRPKKEEAKEVAEDEKEEEKKEEEIVSRSGRKIRPKRYMDEQTEENTALPSPAPKKRRGASPSAEKDKPEPKEKPQDKNLRAYNTVQLSELRELKEPFKSADPERESILIAYLPSEEYCGVKLFQSRPTSFKSESSRLQWDKQAASNAITLKRQLEKGQITPQSISAQLVMDLNLTDEEKATLAKDRDLEVKKSRIHFLKTEMKLIELDAKIKTCLSLEKADTELCLKLIDEILELDLAALMLLKHPTCMETVKRMRVYVGNAPSWEMSENEALTFSKQAHRIRNKADALFITMRDLFDVPDGLSFWEFFNERVAKFKAVTMDLHADKLLEMVHEPIEMTQPSSHTMRAAIDAANDEEPAENETEEAAQKKKATPAKGKKVNPPTKTPLKRQSSRKQQIEEKDSENAAEDVSKETNANEPDETAKTENETSKENNADSEKATEAEKTNEVEKTNENETEETNKEVEKTNEKPEKNDNKETKNEEKGQGDSKKANDDSPKDKESNSKEKDDTKSKAETSKEKSVENDSEEKEEKTSKDSKKTKESDKNSNSDKTSKSKDKNSKEDAKSSKDSKNAKAGDKRRDKGKDEKEKSQEKEKVDVDEPRAKRSRESKKTEPPPRSPAPAKRKSKS